MKWTTNLANAARQRLHQDPNGRRKPRYYDWGDPDGPGERPDTPEFVPVVPFERTPEPGCDYPRENVQKCDVDGETEIDASEQSHKEDAETLSMASVDRPSSWSSEDSLKTDKRLSYLPAYELVTKKPRHRQHPSAKEATERLRESARKHAARIHFPKARPQPNRWLSDDSEEEYEKIPELHCGPCGNMWAKLRSTITQRWRN